MKNKLKVHLPRKGNYQFLVWLTLQNYYEYMYNVYILTKQKSSFDLILLFRQMQTGCQRGFETSGGSLPSV